jgi:hypothetical protein
VAGGGNVTTAPTPPVHVTTRGVLTHDIEYVLPVTELKADTTSFRAWLESAQAVSTA